MILAALFCAPLLAEDDEGEAPGKCTCHKGHATWEYLRSPMVPPEDPPRCPNMVAGGNCGGKRRPQDADAECWGSRKKECFFKRHAYSWDISCSVCWADDKCEACNDLIGGPDPVAAGILEDRMKAEAETLKGELVICKSKHFYVVTNLHKKVKVVTKRGSRRLMTSHELAHLFAQRCEQAFDDFDKWFGGNVLLPKPMAVYITDTLRENDAIGHRYFGRAGIHMNYAFAYNNRIANGLCGNGFVMNYQEQHSDHHLHGFARHQIGHILFSCWHVHSGFEDKCPRWAWVGAAHFLEKLLDVHTDYATFCYGEADGGIGPMSKWERRVKALVKAETLQPIETFFNKTSLSKMMYPDHLRAWSYMDLGMREDRDRWLKLLIALRNGAQEGPAFKEAMDLTPEDFHQRWSARVMGKRKRLGPEKRDELFEGDALLRELLQLQTSDDIGVIAGKLRGLDVIKDVKTAEVAIGYLTHASDLVRETVHHLLLKTSDEDVLTFLREEGLADGRKLVRAGVARALGELKHEPARFALEQMLKDRDWLSRANAAYALQRIENRIARRALQAALDDRHPKAWISVADAFAHFPGRSKDATALIAPRLEHKLWQVRMTACRALRRCGTTEAVDPLLSRFEEEEGRLKLELYRALVGVTGVDQGPDPAKWRRWWEAEKEKHGGVPPRPERAPEPGRNPADERYGFGDEEDIPDVPHHYGKRFFSRSVCFVLDTSGSMKLNMKVPEEAARKLGDIPTSGTRAEIAKQALIDTLKKLDPRTKVRVVFFNTNVKLWKDNLATANTSTVLSLTRAIDRTRPDGETNFYGALKAALGLHELPTLNPKLDVIPDTVFFLTDGRPTHGEITAMPELTSWMTNLNRWAKIRLHVIALGELNVDLPSLGKLAAAGNGELVHVPEM